MTDPTASPASPTSIESATTPPPLRVLHIVAAGEFGGAEAQILALVRELTQRSVAVFVATFYDAELTRRLQASGIATQALRSRLPLQDYIQVKKITVRFAPHVIHTHGVRASLAGRSVGEVLGIPVVTTVHSDLHHDYAQPLKRAFMMALEHISRDRSARVIAVSKALAAVLMERGYSGNQVVTIPNGLDLEQARQALWAAQQQPARIRERLDLLPNAYLLITVARLQAVKNLPFLVRALAGLQGVDGCPVHLLLVGDGPARAALERQADNLAADEGTRRVHLLGERHDVAALLAEADVFVLPSVMEGMPISILEAMHSGLPVVASRVGGIPDLVVEGNSRATGVLFPVNDDAALRTALRRVLSASDWRRQMKENAQARVTQALSMGSAAEKTRRLYEIVTKS